MKLPRPDQPSLLISFALLAAVSVLLVLPAHGVYSYWVQKQQVVDDMKRQAEASLDSLAENTLPFLQAYAIWDYQNLIQTEMLLQDYVAILVDDLNMARVLGRSDYISGMIRAPRWAASALRPLQCRASIVTVLRAGASAWSVASGGRRAGRFAYPVHDG